MPMAASKMEGDAAAPHLLPSILPTADDVQGIQLDEFVEIEGVAALGTLIQQFY